MSVRATQAITISITAEPKFDELPVDLATQMIYDRVVIACEEKKVRLSWEGNHSSLGYKGIQAYDQKKEQRALFNIEVVQLAFSKIDDFLIHCATGCDSSKLSKDMTVFCKDLIHPGDFIVAMLFKGYSAKFINGYKDQFPHFDASPSKKRTTMIEINQTIKAGGSVCGGNSTTSQNRSERGSR